MKDIRMTEVTGSILYTSRQINNKIFAADKWGDVFRITKDDGKIEQNRLAVRQSNYVFI
jgi:hypothetical protein